MFTLFSETQITILHIWEETSTYKESLYHPICCFHHACPKGSLLVCVPGTAKRTWTYPPFWTTGNRAMTSDYGPTTEVGGPHSVRSQVTQCYLYSARGKNVTLRVALLLFTSRRNDVRSLIKTPYAVSALLKAERGSWHCFSWLNSPLIQPCSCRVTLNRTLSVCFYVRVWEVSGARPDIKGWRFCSSWGRAVTVNWRSSGTDTYNFCLMATGFWVSV